LGAFPGILSTTPSSGAKERDIINSSFNPDLSVLLPSFEEGANLRWFLPELKAQLTSLAVSHEILVIDTEVPHDETPEVCKTHGVVYLAREGGPLYSHALKTGINRSKGRWVICMDSDGSHPPRFLPDLWAARSRADLIIASRYIPGGRTENPAILILLSYLVNVAFRLILGFPCRDVSNSFRLYRGESLRSLKLSCKNFDILEEILLQLGMNDMHFTVLEIPFTFEARRMGKTKRDLVAFAFGYLATLARLHKIKKSISTRYP
jgi:dolichol-phosphate mannosyltransferase